MKTHIAYNLKTGEVLMRRCTKGQFVRALHKTERFNRAVYGVEGKWVFRLPENP